MCGIVGYHSVTRHDYSLKMAMETMSYRGPDSSGKHIMQANGYFLGVGHVRLKVLDLDDRSAQPFFTASRCSLIVFNGEIYNFESLKELLPDHQWRTSSDTEVIAELLEAYGDSIVAKFNGIFAIARVCLSNGNLTLFRDPLGVKPLYYSVNDGELFFASEIKSLRHFPVDMKVSHADLVECLNFGYVHEPNTGFEEINKVAPGEIVSNNSGNISRARFSYESSGQFFSERVLTAALKRQCVSDVPLGTFFSGGADSTVIASLVDSDLLYINTRLGDDSNDEERFAKELASKFERNLLTANLSPENDIERIVEVVDKVVIGVEEPITDLTYSVSADLAQLAREKGFTVMLSGMGADEIFGGYLRYYIVKYNWLFNPLFKLYLVLCKFRNGGDKHKLDRIRNYLDEKNFLRKYARLVGYFSRDELEKCYGTAGFNVIDKTIFNRLEHDLPNGASSSNLSTMRYLELKGFLAHNLTVADKSSMKASVELRVPFLDLEIVSRWLGNNVEKSNARSLGKKPLLELLRKELKFSWSPFTKTGFNPPISRFFSSLDVHTAISLICTSEMCKVFERQGLEDLVTSCFTCASPNYHKIWQLLFVSRWLKHWSK